MHKDKELSTSRQFYRRRTDIEILRVWSDFIIYPSPGIKAYLGSAVLTTRRQQGQDEERAVAYVRVSGCQMPVEEKRQSGLTGGGVVVVLVVNRLER